MAGNQPFTYMSCMNQNFCYLSYLIYPFETFEFFRSCIRGQWTHRQPTSEVPAAGLLTGHGGHQKTGGADYRITRLGNVPDCQTWQCVNVNVTTYKVGRLYAAA